MECFVHTPSHVSAVVVTELRGSVSAARCSEGATVRPYRVADDLAIDRDAVGGRCTVVPLP